jgi:hypothetical protein
MLKQLVLSRACDYTVSMRFECSAFTLKPTKTGLASNESDLSMSYVRCINNRGYEASLTIGAIYKVLPDNSDRVSLRVIDNDGEDYLYDSSRFEPIEYDDAQANATEVITVHLDPMLKGILRAEALAAQKSVSALLREWIDERLDLPVGV